MSNKDIKEHTDGLRIAISGKSGCGNTTVSRMLSERLGLKMVNYTFRSVAQEDGISFDEVCKRAEQSDDDDLRVEKTQVELARREPSVLGSRLAIWMLEDAHLKVFLTASAENRAGRILEREGGSLKEQMDVTAARDLRDHNRYIRLYKIDNNNHSMADLIINTDRLSAAQVTDIIESAARTIASDFGLPLANR